MVCAESVTEDVEAGGEMTNQRTEDPILAAWTTATSPTPPGGEMTTRFWLLVAAAAIIVWEEERVNALGVDGWNAFVDWRRRSATATRRFFMML